jgi:hypothetical protein
MNNKTIKKRKKGKKIISSLSSWQEYKRGIAGGGNQQKGKEEKERVIGVNMVKVHYLYV